MEFGPDSAGVIAPIIAVLILAEAFRPTYAGVVPIGPGRRRGTFANLTTGAGVYHGVSVTIALVALLLNCYVVLMRAELTGTLATLAIATNFVGLGFLVGSLIGAVWGHLVSYEDREADPVNDDD